MGKKKKIIQTYTFTYENTNKQTKTHILYGWTKANTHKCYDKHDLACTLKPSHFAPMFTLAHPSLYSPFSTSAISRC